MRQKLLGIFLFGSIVMGAVAGGALAGAFAALAVMNNRVAAGTFAGTGAPGDGLSTAALAQRVSAVLPTAPRDGDELLAAVRATRPAVVTVWNFQYVRRSFFSQAELEPATSGSGVIFDKRGYIATNAHVIQGANNLEVVFLDGRRAPAQIIRFDERFDVAILRVEGVPLPAVAPLADSSTIEPGMRVLAIGSPLGTDYQNTVTTGIIAGLNRHVKQWGLDRRTLTVREVDAVETPLIQTDAAINSGNSGGPLINLQGEVVGLNTLIVRDNGGTTLEGLGFAIPSNVVRALADEWIDNHRRGWLGVQFTAIDPVVARDDGLSRSSGAIITQVSDGTPAQAAGLQVGDIVIAVNNTALDLDHALVDSLWRFHAGDQLRLTVDRKGQEVNLVVTLAVYPGDGQ